MNPFIVCVDIKRSETNLSENELKDVLQTIVIQEFDMLYDNITWISPTHDQRTYCHHFVVSDTETNRVKYHHRQLLSNRHCQVCFVNAKGQVKTTKCFNEQSFTSYFSV